MAHPSMTREQARKLIEVALVGLPPSERGRWAVDLADRIVDVAVPGVPEFNDLSKVYRRFSNHEADEAVLDRVMESVSIIPFGDPLKRPMLELGRWLRTSNADAGGAGSLLDVLTEIAHVALTNPLHQADTRVSGLLRLVLQAEPLFHGPNTDDVELSRRDDRSIRMWIDPGRASAEDIRVLLHALNDVHVAAGGRGLTFDLDENEILILQAADA